jgi:hypothetical protein
MNDFFQVGSLQPDPDLCISGSNDRDRGASLAACSGDLAPARRSLRDRRAARRLQRLRTYKTDTDNEADGNRRAGV